MKNNVDYEETEDYSPSPNKRFGSFITIIVFATIGIVYLISLLAFFPNLPITTRNAEKNPTFMKIYPPFRMDEINYYTMAQNIISGEP
ncbi:MAG TPA: hypothetical protein ENH82_04480, partial [bacterium]|nr:hypothetical protein [bacterium]